MLKKKGLAGLWVVLLVYGWFRVLQLTNSDKLFVNASNRFRHEKQANNLPKTNRAKKVVPNFDNEKDLFLLTFSYFFM